MFEQQIVDVRKVNVQYVDILKNIFKIDYGIFHTPIVIFKYEWIQ
jgi:hypothetical protein